MAILRVLGESASVLRMKTYYKEKKIPKGRGAVTRRRWLKNVHENNHLFSDALKMAIKDENWAKNVMYVLWANEGIMWVL